MYGEPDDDNAIEALRGFKASEILDLTGEDPLDMFGESGMSELDIDDDIERE